MSRHAAARGRWRRDAGVIVLFVLACAIIAVAQLAERLWPLLVLAGLAGAVVYGARRARRPAPPRVIQGRAELRHITATYGPQNPGRSHPKAAGPNPEAASLRAERDDLRRHVAKLEDDAARTDDILNRLESLTGKPVERLIESFERAQRIYGPAVTGKTERAQ